MDQDTIHLLFPNLNKLLNFQRKFLIRLESIAEAPWQDQRWGLPFIENVSDLARSIPASYSGAYRRMILRYTNHTAQTTSVPLSSCLPTNRASWSVSVPRLICRLDDPLFLFLVSINMRKQPLNHLINVKGELPAFLIKPVQRVCKYPLLLDVRLQLFLLLY